MRKTGAGRRRHARERNHPGPYPRRYLFAGPAGTVAFQSGQPAPGISSLSPVQGRQRHTKQFGNVHALAPLARPQHDPGPRLYPQTPHDCSPTPATRRPVPWRPLCQQHRGTRDQVTPTESRDTRTGALSDWRLRWQANRPSVGQEISPAGVAHSAQVTDRHHDAHMSDGKEPEQPDGIRPSLVCHPLLWWADRKRRCRDRENEIGSWELREAIRSSIYELEALLDSKPIVQGKQALVDKARRELEEATEKLGHNEHRGHLVGSHLTVAQIHVNTARTLLLQAIPPNEVLPLLPGLVGVIREQLREDDPGGSTLRKSWGSANSIQTVCRQFLTP